jgi:hypothetical protein
MASIIRVEVKSKQEVSKKQATSTTLCFSPFFLGLLSNPED